MQPELYMAAKSGDFNCLTQMPGYPDIDFNQTTPVGNNLFHVAAQYKHENFIKQLLDQCGSSRTSLLFQGNRKRDTPLHIAAKVGAHEICQIFIDFTNTSVSYAEGKRLDRQKELLRMVNVDKDTALHYAVRHDRSLVVKLLIKVDPDLCNITNDARDSPLYLATAQGYLETAKTMLDAFPPSFSYNGYNGSRGMTALHAARYYRSHGHDLVKAIVKRRPQLIRQRDAIGWTPLFYAACYDEAKTVQLFLLHDHSAAYLLDKDGESALHITAFLGHINVMEELIKSSPDACELINKKGQTALHSAVIGAKLNAVKAILESPCFEHLINEQDDDGNTALHLAALHRQHDIMKCLAPDPRVDIRLSNKKHKTALGIYDRDEEVDSEAISPYVALKMFFGIHHMQDQAIECVQKRLKGESINNDMNNQGKVDPPKLSAIKISEIAAVLIATVTFAAAFTVPGGLTNQGTATSAGKAAFKAFVVANTAAFYSSILAVYLQFNLSFETVGMRYKQALQTWVYRYSIRVAMVGLIVAFACGTFAVLPESSGLLAVFVYALFGCLVTSLSMIFVPRSIRAFLEVLLEILDWVDIWRTPQYQSGVKSFLSLVNDE